MPSLVSRYGRSPFVVCPLVDSSIALELPLSADILISMPLAIGHTTLFLRFLLGYHSKRPSKRAGHSERRLRTVTLIE